MHWSIMATTKFVVEDRSKGTIVAEGTITAAGDVSFTSSSLQPSEQIAIAELIKTDAAAGHSGGQLPYRGLQWMTLFTR